jgi:hypothetical protein
MKWKKLVPVKEHETTSREVCDLCGEELGCRSWDCSEVTIEARLGEIYPEGDFRTVETFDCCAKCWTDKVQPAIRALGATLYRYPYDSGRLKFMPLDPERSE